jgi:asparagine synthase (glutamine-hydrolysing)
MCGITGFWSAEPGDEREMPAQGGRMNDQLAHRGPDDAGVWVDAAAGIVLASRRLAIVDLSPAGHQPMVSASGRFVIAYNGEVYNFGELRRELETAGRPFRGHSDTEVMLAAVEEWGLECALGKFLGMFAFALWDRRERALHLVRDRLGIKPLYYGWAGKSLLFGSELKALRAHPGFRREVDRDALGLYLKYNYIPQPFSIYRGIQKLPPGCLLTLRASGLAPGSLPVPAPYWSARDAAERGAREPFGGSEPEGVEELDRLLRDAVRLRMIADVPLGAFLSGGIDSSTVVALMQAQSSRPVKTFTIGFREDRFNEAEHARAVAAHLGTEHTELYVTPAEAQAVIPRLPDLYDEPFADSSQVPTYLVSALARRHVTVSLSGDGGDELFGGYNWYVLGEAAWKRLGWMPLVMRRGLARGIKFWRRETYDRYAPWLSRWLNRFGRPGLVGEKMHKIAALLSSSGPEEVYRYMVSHWKQPAGAVVGARDVATVLTDRAQWARLPEFVARMMFFDLVAYLPDDILAKVDRASMGVSLEARVPLLDHRVVEFAARLPLAWKIRPAARPHGSFDAPRQGITGNEGQGKWLLRQVLYRYVSRELVERPKRGFILPIAEWLRGPFRDWAEDLLSAERLEQEGFFYPAPVRQLWTEHLAGREGGHESLWALLMFQAWLARQKGESGDRAQK